MEETEYTSDTNKKELREKELITMFKTNVIQFKLISTGKSWSKEVREYLLAYKMILQKQLPRMPKEYIIKQIFNEKHKNILCLVNNTMVGGVCYRPFYKQSFVELVFLAVDSSAQVTGHGSMIIDILKEHCKREIQNIETSFLDYLSYPQRLKHPIYLMVYADNYAIGFFKKQGFSTEIYFKNWRGYIKDYEGGTLMQCKVLWEINYLTKIETIEKKRIEFVNKISKMSSFNVLRNPPNYAEIKSVWDIPGLKEAKLTENMLNMTTKRLKNVFRYIISDIRTDTHAWPFLLPVNEKEVPDYYQIIKVPMDISKVEKNVEDDKYEDIESFEQDFNQIFKNCYIYNAPSTTYCKCAHILEKRFAERIKEVKCALNSEVKNFDKKHGSDSSFSQQDKHKKTSLNTDRSTGSLFSTITKTANTRQSGKIKNSMPLYGQHEMQDKPGVMKKTVLEAVKLSKNTTNKKNNENKSDTEDEKAENSFDLNLEDHQSGNFF